MSGTSPATLCLGEALVDLVGEWPVHSLSEVKRFAPHFGGVTANVAVIAARAGVRVTLAGGVGDDQWGHWLQARLLAEGVDTSRFALLEGVQTQLAFVAVDQRGEPTYRLYGEVAETLVAALEETVDEAVDEAGALFISSNTLVGHGERAVTMRARERALAAGLPIVFDCNLRLHRWSSRADAAASANACVPGALLVRVNRDEAELLTGERDAERAATALRKAGAELVVISQGSGGALLRGAGGIHAESSAPAARVLSTAGAGDALTGTLLAALAQSGFYPAAVAAALPAATAAAAAACERWGSID